MEIKINNIRRYRHAELGSASKKYDEMLNQVQHDAQWRMRILFSFVIILTALLISSPNGVKSQHELNQYLITAAQNNPGLKSKFSAYMAGMEQVPQVGGLPDLKFAFGYFIQPIETRVGPQRAKLSIAQTFPWFGSLSSREDVATQRASALYEVFEESKSKLYYEIKSAYFELYFIEKSIDISLENIDILNKLLQLTITKIESGSSSIVDDYRVEMELNDIENQLALLRDSQHEYRIKFNRLLNVPDVSFVSIPDSLWQADLFYSREVLLDSIEVNNHEVKQIEHRISAWENKETAAHKAYSPNILLGFDYTFVGEYDNPALSDSQRKQMTLPLEDDERIDWHYVPKKDRKGLPLKTMTAEQIYLVHILLNESLGQAGYSKTLGIMHLESILRDIAVDQGRANALEYRDPTNYFVTVFGSPEKKGIWGWSFEGHHISQNFTVADGNLIATSPAFFGANPHNVPNGPARNMRVLGSEEDRARRLLDSLNDAQLKKVVIGEMAPKDIFSAASPRILPSKPQGINASNLTSNQVELLHQLILVELRLLMEPIT